MVNYMNPLAMYHGKGGHYGAGSWYGWQPQQFDEQQAWMHWQGGGGGGVEPWSEGPGGAELGSSPHLVHHQFPKREPAEREPSGGGAGPLGTPPPRTDLSSPGSGSPCARPPIPRSPYEWMKKPNYQTQPNPGKTRTKDKYRVVYSDHQRLELEKEFHYSRYITIRRKAELAANLGLSERQVKIWFQNRRAKERKQVKKREEVVLKDKGEHASLQHAQLHHATVLHHQQMMNGMMHHHHYHQAMLPPEPLVPGGVSAVPLL